MFPRCPVSVLRFCARRGAFSGGKNIYLGSGDLITHIGPLSAPRGGCSGMDCRRWVWMTMSQLGRYSHLGMCSVLGAQACCWAWFFVFFALNRFIFQRANMYLHLFQCFPAIQGGSNGWMVLDDVPNLEILYNLNKFYFASFHRWGITLRL